MPADTQPEEPLAELCARLRETHGVAMGLAPCVRIDTPDLERLLDAIERYPAEIEAAYREGYADGHDDGRNAGKITPKESWEISDAHAALHATAPQGGQK